MSFAFTDGLVATAAQLNQAIGPVTLGGLVKITPVANTPTSVAVKFPTPFTAAPVVSLTPSSTVPGTSVRGWAVSNITTTGFLAWIYRINTNATTMLWQAWLAPTLFTTGQPAYADLLNQGASGMVCRVGSVTITPSAANTPTSSTVTFSSAFASTPTVQVSPVATTPSQILGCSATGVTATGCIVRVTRTNTTATVLNYIALGRV